MSPPHSMFISESIDGQAKAEPMNEEYVSLAKESAKVRWFTRAINAAACCICPHVTLFTAVRSNARLGVSLCEVETRDTLSKFGMMNMLKVTALLLLARGDCAGFSSPFYSIVKQTSRRHLKQSDAKVKSVADFHLLSPFAFIQSSLSFPTGNISFCSVVPLQLSWAKPDSQGRVLLLIGMLGWENGCLKTSRSLFFFLSMIGWQRGFFPQKRQAVDRHSEKEIISTGQLLWLQITRKCLYIYSHGER